MRSITMKQSLILGGVLVAALTVGGATAAGAASGANNADRSVSVSTDDKGPTVETQKGIVLEGSGEADGLAAMVTVYENDRYGNTLQVVLGDPDEDLIGNASGTDAFVADGALSATVQIAGHDAVLTGTVAESGRPEFIRESLQDAGEQIVSKGTHTQLLVDATLTYQGHEVPLTFAPAFAYDLEVRRVALYGQ